METHRDLTEEERKKAVELDVSLLPPPKAENYQRLLLNIKLHGGRNHGRLRGDVPVDLLEDILATAKNTRTYEAAIKSLDMKLAFRGATSEEGRPPIKGSQNN